jgi:hypothetical protein
MDRLCEHLFERVCCKALLRHNYNFMTPPLRHVGLPTTQEARRTLWGQCVIGGRRGLVGQAELDLHAFDAHTLLILEDGDDALFGGFQVAAQDQLDEIFLDLAQAGVQADDVTHGGVG